MSAEDAAAAIPMPREEMLTGTSGRMEWWVTPPELVIVTTVLRYDPTTTSQFIATSEQISEEDIDAMAGDLEDAVALFTGGRDDHGVVIRREAALPGDLVRTVRSGQIVVARYHGLQATTQHIGLGGRSVRAAGTIRAGSVMLDADYDRGDPRRALLRTHELGHALGFNHVNSRPSVMNPRIGIEPTPEDRETATRAVLAQESAARALSIWPRSEN